MKLNLDTSLPEGKKYNLSKEQKDQAPDYIKQILEIEGVKSIFQITDFIAVERYAKADWRDILPKVRKVFEHGDPTEQETDVSLVEERLSNHGQEADPYGEYEVKLQMFKGIPIHVKVISELEERRFALPERFTEAAMKAQPTATNYVLEREWVDQGVRYGKIEEVGEQVVQEISAAYDQERLEQLVAKAFAEQEGKPLTRTELTEEELISGLNAPDWEKRYAALSRIDPEPRHLPLLEKALQDSKLSIRRLAVAYLGMMEDERVLPLLYEALQDKSPVIRRTAGDALSDLGNPKAIPAMCQALKDKNKLVRWRAARFLYEVGDKTALPALREAEDDPEFEVSLQVKLAIERIEKGEEAEGTVWQQMTRSREENK